MIAASLQGFGPRCWPLQSESFYNNSLSSQRTRYDASSSTTTCLCCCVGARCSFLGNSKLLAFHGQVRWQAVGLCLVFILYLGVPCGVSWTALNPAEGLMGKCSRGSFSKFTPTGSRERLRFSRELLKILVFLEICKVATRRVFSCVHVVLDSTPWHSVCCLRSLARTPHENSCAREKWGPGHLLSRLVRGTDSPHNKSNK